MSFNLPRRPCRESSLARASIAEPHCAPLSGLHAPRIHAPQARWRSPAADLACRPRGQIADMLLTRLRAPTTASALSL
jgi:hypothetical protein